MRPRSRVLTSCHFAKAVCAARTTRSTSSADARGTEARALPVAGSISSKEDTRATLCKKWASGAQGASVVPCLRTCIRCSVGVPCVHLNGVRLIRRNALLFRERPAVGGDGRVWEVVPKREVVVDGLHVREPLSRVRVNGHGNGSFEALVRPGDSELHRSIPPVAILIGRWSVHCRHLRHRLGGQR